MLDYRRVLVDAVDRFDQRYETETRVPQLAVHERRYTAVEAIEGDNDLIDHAGYMFNIGGEGLVVDGKREDWTEETLQAHYDAALKELYREAVGELVTDASELLDRRYDGLETDIEVDEVVIDPDRDTAAYTRGRGVVKVPDSFYSLVDPAATTVTDPGAWSTVVHETAHALQFGTSPVANQLASHISESLPDDAVYKEDVRRAGIEAITKYEEPRPGSSRIDHHETLQRLKDPWRLHELAIEPSGPYKDDPYALGHLAAYAIEEGLTATHGREDGKELTRSFLLEAVTTPKGLEGAIDRSFELRGLPSYPAMVQQYYNEVAAADDRDTMVNETAHTLDRGLATWDPDAMLEGFLDGHAFIDAVDAVMDEQPFAVEQLETTLEMVEEVFGPDTA